LYGCETWSVILWRDTSDLCLKTDCTMKLLQLRRMKHLVSSGFT
jgi:hypothetical protein